MATTQQPKKGILKNKGPKTSEAALQARDAKEVAIHHARILQHRKEVEEQIFQSLVVLSEFPQDRSAPYTAAHPAASDIAGFKQNVRLFQPSDYDDLIEERNINGLCGYSLCAKPKRDGGPGGEWKITRSGDIIKRKDFEMWCSQQCARRALYVKVQLNETAAWERAGILDIAIDLLDEDKEDTEPEKAARQLEKLNVEDQRQAARDSAVLAWERGEAKPHGKKITVAIREKQTKSPEAMESTPGENEHLVVEGYRSKTGAEATKS